MASIVDRDSIQVNYNPIDLNEMAVGNYGSIASIEGFSPELAIVLVDATTEILRLIKWIGISNTYPIDPVTGVDQMTDSFLTINPRYIGATGLVSSTASAVNIRGTNGSSGGIGSQGPQGVQGIPGDNGTNGDNAYVYIAYADNDIGGSFTNIFNPSLNYIAIKSTTVSIPSPIYSDFTGLWKNYKGATGLQGPTGANGITTRAITFNDYGSDDLIVDASDLMSGQTSRAIFVVPDFMNGMIITNALCHISQFYPGTIMNITVTIYDSLRSVVGTIPLNCTSSYTAATSSIVLSANMTINCIYSNGSGILSNGCSIVLTVNQ